jgi:hypothetical protein
LDWLGLETASLILQNATFIARGDDVSKRPLQAQLRGPELTWSRSTCYPEINLDERP